MEGDQYHITHEPQKTYWRILYRAKSWNKSQWLAVKVEYNAMGGNIRCVVTDLFWKEPKRLYEHYYCKRGDCELYIKELKRGVDAEYVVQQFQCKSVPPVLACSSIRGAL